MVDDISPELEKAKLDAMKELAYGASHEINNPLANIAARAQNLMRDEQHPERRRSLEAIYQQAMRAHEMISDLMLFARPPKLVPDRVELAEFFEKLTEQFAKDCERYQISWQVKHPSPAPTIHADSQQLLVALSALCRNSIEALGTNGSIEIVVAESESKISIELTDTGPGISEQVREHLFDPFYSGREAGRGLGFGLSKCWRIITDHGGTIVVNNISHPGAQFTITLPKTCRRDS